MAQPCPGGGWERPTIPTHKGLRKTERHTITCCMRENQLLDKRVPIPSSLHSVCHLSFCLHFGNKLKQAKSIQICWIRQKNQSAQTNRSAAGLLPTFHQRRNLYRPFRKPLQSVSSTWNTKTLSHTSNHCFDDALKCWDVSSTLDQKYYILHIGNHTKQDAF